MDREVWQNFSASTPKNFHIFQHLSLVFLYHYCRVSSNIVVSSILPWLKQKYGLLFSSHSTRYKFLHVFGLAVLRKLVVYGFKEFDPSSQPVV